MLTRTQRNPALRVLALAAYLIFAAQSSALAQVPAKTKSVSLSQAGLAPFGPNSIWVWGIEGDRFALLRTNNVGRSWTSCSLPAGLSEFVQNENGLSGASEYWRTNPPAASFSDANSGWLTWISITKEGVPNAVVTAHTTDRCRTWSVATEDWGKLVDAGDGIPSEPAATPQYYAQRNIATQFIGRNGWALVWGTIEPRCCQDLMRTIDGGKTWQWIPATAHGSGYSGPLVRWNFLSLLRAWLTIPDIYDDGSSILWRTADGGQTWENLSPQIRPPDELTEGFISQDMSVPAFSSTNPSVGTLGILYFEPMDAPSGKGNVNDLAIYRTTPMGVSRGSYPKSFRKASSRRKDLHSKTTCTDSDTFSTPTPIPLFIRMMGE